MSAGHLSMRNKFLMHGVALLLILTAHPVKATETAPEPPQHLTLARQLQANVAPNQNSYRHSEQISVPQDGPTKGYTMFADCSGLIIALLDRAASSTRSLMSTPSMRKRPFAEDFVRSIQGSQGFQKITSIENIQPGDLIAWEFTSDLDKKAAKDTGHVMLIDTKPVKVENRAPFVHETTQYELFVIDSSTMYHDPQDTRVQADGSKIKGIGRGKLRLYLTQEGEIVGFANNFANAMFQPLNPAWSQYSTGKSKTGAIGRALY